MPVKDQVLRKLIPHRQLNAPPTPNPEEGRWHMIIQRPNWGLETTANVRCTRRSYQGRPCRRDFLSQAQRKPGARVSPETILGT